MFSCQIAQPTACVCLKGLALSCHSAVAQVHPGTFREEKFLPNLRAGGFLDGIYSVLCALSVEQSVAANILTLKRGFLARRFRNCANCGRSTATEQ